MKTNRFEESLRKKLEDIQPEFDEADWQNFSSFRGAAGSAGRGRLQGWVAYAASVLLAVAAVAGGLSVIQYQQNKQLRQEVAALKKSVERSLEAIQDLGANVESRTDTVYVHKEAPVHYQWQGSEDADLVQRNARDFTERKPITANAAEEPTEEAEPVFESTGRMSGGTSDKSYRQLFPPNIEGTEASMPSSGSQSVLIGLDLEPIVTEMIARQSPLALAEGRFATILPHLKVYRALASPASTDSEVVRKWNRTALKRAGKNRGRNPDPGAHVGLASNSVVKIEKGDGAPDTKIITAVSGDKPVSLRPGSNESGAPSGASETEFWDAVSGNSTTSSPEAAKDTKKEEKIIPVIVTAFPYRVGLGQSFDRLGRATSVQVEALVSKRFYFGLGVSSRMMKSVDFVNDLTFKHLTGQDFVKRYGAPFASVSQVPGGLEKFRITDIATRVEGVDIPVRAGCRAELGHSFTLVAGVETAIKVNERRRVMYDVHYENGALLQLVLLEMCKNRLFDNFTITTGIEKSIGALVLKGEAYLGKSLKPVPYNQDSRAPGARIQIMYQFGQRN